MFRCAGRPCDGQPSEQTCFEFGGVAMPDDRLICRHLYDVSQFQARVKTDMRQSIASQSVRWLGKISSKCVYFIDNPFKVVVFVRIYCRKSGCLFKHVVFVSFFAIFVTKGQTAFNHITAQNKR